MSKHVLTLEKQDLSTEDQVKIIKNVHKEVNKLDTYSQRLFNIIEKIIDLYFLNFNMLKISAKGKNLPYVPITTFDVERVAVNINKYFMIKDNALLLKT